MFKVKKTSFALRIWEICNRPIVANSFAVMIIATCGFFVTNYIQCKDRVNREESRINRLMSEIIHRHSALLSAMTANVIQEIRFERIAAALNPDKTYLFLDNKGRYEQEFAYEIDRIVYGLIPPSMGSEQQGTDVRTLIKTQKDDECRNRQRDGSVASFSECWLILFDKFVMSSQNGSGVDFRSLLVDAINRSSQADKAQFLDLMDRKKNYILTYVNISSENREDVPLFALGLWNISRDGNLFPGSLCRCKAVWP